MTNNRYVPLRGTDENLVCLLSSSSLQLDIIILASLLNNTNGVS